MFPRMTPLLTKIIFNEQNVSHKTLGFKIAMFSPTFTLFSRKGVIIYVSTYGHLCVVCVHKKKLCFLK